MSRYALLAALLAGACASPASMDARMNPLVGADEPALIAAMGRAPDAAAEPAPGTRLLQWRWQRSYAVSDRTLAYTYAGGTIRPIAHSGTGTVRDECLAEWTLVQGIATRYRWLGNDCSAVATELAARPLESGKAPAEMRRRPKLQLRNDSPWSLP